MILDALLKEVKVSRQLDAVFKAYDAVRRPRSQRVVASSKITGQILCGREPGIGLDPQKIREALAPRWGFIMSLDMKDHKRDALSHFTDMSH
jgi:salicylate hydroxylase